MDEIVEAVAELARAFEALPLKAKQALAKQAALLDKARWN